MGIMGLKFLKKGRMLDGAMWFGKVCTAVMFVGLFVLFLFPMMPTAWVNAMILVMMAVMVFTLCKYVPVFQKMQRDEQKEGVKQL